MALFQVIMAWLGELQDAVVAEELLTIYLGIIQKALLKYDKDQ